MYYQVVKTTPEEQRFEAGVKHTYAVVSNKEYDRNYATYRDRTYQGGMKKKEAKRLALHLNNNTNQTFRPDCPCCAPKKLKKT